jgi:hypothetical protein
MNHRFIDAPWLEVIFAQFENELLKKALDKCAKEIECKVWYAEERSVDIFEIPHFVAVFEWPLWGNYLWYSYLQRCKETNDDTPWIVIEKNKVHTFPAFETPTAKKWLYFDNLDRKSINQIIAFIKEIKSNLK